MTKKIVGRVPVDFALCSVEENLWVYADVCMWIQRSF
jgi:hypothetical protein